MKADNIDKKTVRKFRTVEHWKVAEQESWYFKMAAKGLHLKTVGILFDEFVKGEPEAVRYRIVPYNNNLSDKQKQEYLDRGWKYIASYGKSNVFSSPEKLNAPEIDKEFYSVTKLNKEIRLETVFLLAAAVIVLFFIYRDLKESYLILDVVEGRFVRRIIYYITILALLIDPASQYLYKIKLRNSLADNSLDHNVTRNSSWKKYIFNIRNLFAALLLIILIESISQENSRYTSTLPTENTADMPIILLKDVEQDPDLRRSKYGQVIDGVDQDNMIKYQRSLLAPVQFETSEGAVNDNRLYSNGSRVYHVTLDTKIYMLAFPFMADSLASDLIKRYSWKEAEGYSQIEHPDLDLLFVKDPDSYNYYEIIAAKGKGFMYVSYTGEADINIMIDKIVQKIPLIE